MSNRPPPSKELDKESPTTHSTSLSRERLEDFPTIFLQLVSKREVISAVSDLKNNKTPSNDGLTSEDIKK